MMAEIKEKRDSRVRLFVEKTIQEMFSSESSSIRDYLKCSADQSIQELTHRDLTLIAKLGRDAYLACCQDDIDKLIPFLYSETDMNFRLFMQAIQATARGRRYMILRIEIDYIQSLSIGFWVPFTIIHEDKVHDIIGLIVRPELGTSYNWKLTNAFY